MNSKDKTRSFDCSTSSQLRMSGSTIVPSAPWRVVQVNILSPYRFHVRFADGLNGVVDISKLVLNPDAGVFASLCDESLFRQIRLELGVVTWPGDIDLAPDTMHAEIKLNREWVVS